MAYKCTEFGVTVDHDLNPEEIKAVHKLWRVLREEEEFLKWSWNDFKDHLGLDHELQRQPKWKIANKEKWLWSKLKYGI
jgi:hypothetical protein